MKKLFKNSIVFIFLGILSLLSINQLLGFIPDMNYNENKKKAELPDFDVKRLDQFPKLFDTYYTDNFKVRGLFLNSMGFINTKIWKKSPKPDRLIIGKEKWLYSIAKEYDYYIGKRMFSEKELQLFLKEFEQRNKVLDSMGIKMYLMIAPIKYSVYPEFLPDYLKVNQKVNLSEQIVRYLKKHSDINIIYPKQELINNKKHKRLYYKGDNHWNYFGGYVASKMLLNEIKKDYTNVPIYELDDYTFDTVFNWGGNLTNMTGNKKFCQENRYKPHMMNAATDYEPVKYEVPKGFAYKWEYQMGYRTDNDSLPSLVFVRDSYGAFLMPYLKNSFYRSTFIFDAWKHARNFEIIEQEKPDIVVYQILESLITIEKFKN